MLWASYCSWILENASNETNLWCISENTHVFLKLSEQFKGESVFHLGFSLFTIYHCIFNRFLKVYNIMYVRIFADSLQLSFPLHYIDLHAIGFNWSRIHVYPSGCSKFWLFSLKLHLQHLIDAIKKQIYLMFPFRYKTVFVGYIESIWCSQHDTFGLLSSIRLSSIEPIVFEDIDMLHLINCTQRIHTLCIHLMRQHNTSSVGWNWMGFRCTYTILFELKLKLSHQWVRVTFLLPLLPFLLLLKEKRVQIFCSHEFYLFHSSTFGARFLSNKVKIKISNQPTT